ncbi:MAG: fructose-2,6-bisphosphatase [Thermoleophilia bacterium]|nr:fructose-2,6-bisphosphatase [Thermoleophilia bacterium]
MPPSDLYLIRHGQSEWNAAGRWQGQADPPLSEHGREQAAQLAVSFPDVDVTHVFASDLQRAFDTAVPLARRFDVEPIVEPDLREIDVGSWSGKTRDEIRAVDAPSLERYFEGVRGWTGGETYEEHELRCERAASRVGGTDTDGAVVAVTHGGTLRALVLALLEIDHAHRWRFTGIGHTSVTHLQRGPKGWRLVAYNAVLELPDV